MNKAVFGLDWSLFFWSCPNSGGLRTRLETFLLILSELKRNSDSFEAFALYLVRTRADFGLVWSLCSLSCPNLGGLRTRLEPFLLILSELERTSDSFGPFSLSLVRTWGNFGLAWSLFS